METSLTPGWYPDPTGRYEFRYHNGQRWTADISVDGQRYVEPDDASITRQPAPLPPTVKGRGVAITTLVLGICAVSLAWLPFVFVVGGVCGVVGLIFGIAGFTSESYGRKMLGWGTVLSVVALPLCGAGLLFTREVLDQMREPGPYKLTITACYWENGLQAQGTIENQDSLAHSYSVRLVYRSGGSELDAETVYVNNVASGQAGAIRSYRVAPRPQGDVTCDIDKVQQRLP